MKSLMFLWQTVAVELATRCCTSATMDFKTVQVRAKHEGVSFLTITLPDFGKDFERSLELGQVDRSLFTGFQRKGELPRFLGGFLDRIFVRDSGVLRDEPCIEAILAVRQLTLMFGKIALPCSDARVRRAKLGYITCEQEVRSSDEKLSEKLLDDFKRISSLLFGSLFASVDRKVYYGELIPKHGPGSTADKLLGNEKYNVGTWTERLEEYFPAGEYLLPNWRYYDQLDQFDFLEPGAEMPVKVITVPKTLKTPRIIAMEPTAMQYAQQALQREIYDLVKNDSLLHQLIGFTDQIPNQDLARFGSLSGELATLDLSEASDRVSNRLVREMLAPHAHLLGAVDACRSRRADLHVDGDIQTITLAKFASMGSALCFPIEAMVFLTVVFLGIEQELSAPLCPRVVKQLAGSVRVYGDDIICPVGNVLSVVGALEDFGFRVNTRKSFWNGKFRESCGREFFAGEDVSIVRVREEFPVTRQDATQVISLVDLRNQFYMAGFWETARYLDGKIRDVIKHFPTVEPSSRVLGRVSFLGYGPPEKLHRDHQSPLVKGFVVSAKPPINRLDGYGALTKVLLKSTRRELKETPDSSEDYIPHRDRLQFLDPDVGTDHLERSGRPQSVNIKMGWWPPY